MMKSYIFKFNLVGDAGVGKTSILNRYINDRFSENFGPSMGVSFELKQIYIDGHDIRLQIWDWGGGFRFIDIVADYLTGSMGVFLVFDLARKPSIDHLEDWIEVIKKGVGDNVPIILVGNKNDLKDDRQFTFGEGLELEERYNFEHYFETSAKTGEGINEIFEYLARISFAKYELD